MAGTNTPVTRSRCRAGRLPWRTRSSAGFADSLVAEDLVLVVEDLVGLAVDLPLVGLREVAGLHLLGSSRLGVAGVRLVGHRVLALVREPELRVLEPVALLVIERGHRGPPVVELHKSTMRRHTETPLPCTRRVACERLAFTEL